MVDKRKFQEYFSIFRSELKKVLSSALMNLLNNKARETPSLFLFCHFFFTLIKRPGVNALSIFYQQQYLRLNKERDGSFRESLNFTSTAFRINEANKTAASRKEKNKLSLRRSIQSNRIK